MDQKPLTDKEQANVTQVHKKVTGVEPGQIKMSAEEYATHMEVDLRKRTLADKPLTQIQSELEAIATSPEYERFAEARKTDDDPDELSEAAEPLNARLTELENRLKEIPPDLPGDLLKRKEDTQKSLDALRDNLFREATKDD